jgi:hypothetical protein
MSRERESAPGGRLLRHPFTSSLLLAVVLIAAFASAQSEASAACASKPLAWGPILKQSFEAPDGYRRDLLEEWHAREAYDLAWERAAPLLGSAGRASPRMQFLTGVEQKPSPRAAMWVGPDEAGCRTIFITPGQRRALGKLEGNWRSRDAALTRTLHETAHYFQSDDMLYKLEARELGASKWANAHGPSILGTAKKDHPVEFAQWRDRDQFGANYAGDPRTFGWPGVDRDQFGANYAGDPLTFGWPGARPKTFATEPM